jgi:hypothetical protein
MTTIKFTNHDIKAAAAYLGCEADSDAWLNEDQVSALLQLSVSTLKLWRSGVRAVIPYMKVGARVRYRLGNVVDFWVSAKHEEEQKKRLGWIYIITADELFPICKIGFTTRTPQRRLADMMTAIPFDAYVFKEYKVLDPCEMEKGLHDLVGHARMRGEWFRLSELDIACIHHFATTKERSVEAIQMAAKSSLDMLRT